MPNQTRSHPVTLSAKGLANIIYPDYSGDFHFIIGEKPYACPSFIAQFLSPRISQLHQSDCTINEIKLESIDTSNCFAKFLSLGFGSSVSFESTDYPFLRSVCIELGAIELYETLFIDNQTKITTDTIIARLKHADLIGSWCETDITFAASHFSSLDLSSLLELPVSMIFQILNHTSLTLKNEDSLYEMLSSFIAMDAQYSILLECVKYE
jgi:hypothetical protein